MKLWVYPAEIKGGNVDIYNVETIKIYTLIKQNIVYNITNRKS